MQIKQVINKLQNEEPIVINDKTFSPETFDAIELDTGEKIYWIRNGESLWLSIDPVSEEVILFHDVEVEIDTSLETIFHDNEDYEFSYEGVGKIIDENGEEVDSVTFRDYQSPDGSILRAIEYEVTGDLVAATGSIVPEEELQEA